MTEGADVNWQDDDGFTPLMKCVSWDRSHVTEWLLSIPGLDVDIAAEVREKFEKQNSNSFNLV